MRFTCIPLGELMKCLSVVSRLTLGVCLSWGTSEIRQTRKAFKVARGDRRRHIACNQRNSHAYLPLIVFAVRNHPAAPVQSPPPDAASPLGAPAAYKRRRCRRHRRRVNAHRAQAAASVDASEICVIFKHEYSFPLDSRSLH